MALAVGCGAATLLLLGLPSGGPQRQNPITIQLAHAAELRKALYFFASDHDGKYPKVLAELPFEEISQEARRFRDPCTKQDYDWVYYPGYSLQSPEQSIILASPRTLGDGKRIAVVAEGSVELLNEDDFVKQLSEQLNNK